ncbi:MAG: hypothetical protein Q8S44_02880 [Flavobacteriaceae bacterium]|nr:hypothetical protein [Flavobacteriaceae bacterium]
MGYRDEETCSICGTRHPHIEMVVNTNFEEARCKDCFERYGDVPLETLSASLSRFSLNIMEIPRADLDVLVPLQKKKIALNRETDKKIAELTGAKWVFMRKRRIKNVQEKAKEERDRINAGMDGMIKAIKEKQGR